MGVNHFFDISAVENAIRGILTVNLDFLMVIKSTILMGYAESVREKYGVNIIFSQEFLHKSKTIHNNIHPSRIVVECDDGQNEVGEMFVGLLLKVQQKREKSRFV